MTTWPWKSAELYAARAEIERLGTALVAACDREAAAKEHAADMKCRAEAAEVAWAAGRGVGAISCLQRRLPGAD